MNNIHFDKLYLPICFYSIYTTMCCLAIVLFFASYRNQNMSRCVRDLLLFNKSKKFKEMRLYLSINQLTILFVSRYGD